jgi:hypothetical protein
MQEDKSKHHAESKALGEGRKKGLSRRGFLRGAGLTTVGTVALQTGVLGQQLENQAINNQWSDLTLPLSLSK